MSSVCKEAHLCLEELFKTTPWLTALIFSLFTSAVFSFSFWLGSEKRDLLKKKKRAESLIITSSKFSKQSVLLFSQLDCCVVPSTLRPLWRSCQLSFLAIILSAVALLPPGQLGDQMSVFKQNRWIYALSNVTSTPCCSPQLPNPENLTLVLFVFFLSLNHSHLTFLKFCSCCFIEHSLAVYAVEKNIKFLSLSPFLDDILPLSTFFLVYS